VEDLKVVTEYIGEGLCFGTVQEDGNDVYRPDIQSHTHTFVPTTFSHWATHRFGLGLCPGTSLWGGRGEHLPP